jgi:molybdate transport system substrate-binding protein
MKKATQILSLLLILLSFSVGCTKQEEASAINLNISAAASLKDSMDEIKELYESENSNIKLTINYGGSGTLQKQIEEGADVDVFISAAPKQMDAIEDRDLLLEGTRKDLLLNGLVLVTPKDNSTIRSFDDLTTDKVTHLALGEPNSVPAGQYAEEVFTKLGILDKIKEKTVYAKDVKEVLTWVETGNADAGIVYTTDAKVSDKVQVIATAPADSHTPVIYPAAVIKDSKNGDLAKELLEFLSSDKAISIFEKYGFEVNTK